MMVAERRMERMFVIMKDKRVCESKTWLEFTWELVGCEKRKNGSVLTPAPATPASVLVVSGIFKQSNDIVACVLCVSLLFVDP